MELIERTAEDYITFLGVDPDEISSMSHAERNEMVVALAQMQNIANGVFFHELGSASADHTTGLTKSRSISHHVAHETRAQQSGRDGLTTLERHACLLADHMPQALILAREGRISVKHACAIARRLETRVFRDAMIRDAEMILRWAQAEQWWDFRTRMDAWQTLNDPRDPADLDRMAQDHRSFTSTGVGSERVCVLNTTTEFFDQLMTAMAPVVDAMFGQDWAVAKNEFGENVTTADLVRTHAQRRHDALVQLFRKGWLANHPDPGCAPITHNLIDDATASHQYDLHLHRMSGSTELAPVRTIIEDDIINYRCETLSGLPLTPTSAFRAMMSGHIKAHLSSHGRFLGTTSKDRLFKGDMRRGIMITDRKCTGRGCETPAHLCQVDHIKPHSRGGPTCPGNGGAGCSACHDHKTRLENLGYNFDELP